MHQFQLRTVGGKGLIAETELKTEVVAANATVANSVAAIAMASTTCVATSDALQEQPEVVVAVDTKAFTSLSNSFAGHMITQANRVGCGFHSMTEVQSASCAVDRV